MVKTPVWYLKVVRTRTNNSEECLHELLHYSWRLYIYIYKYIRIRIGYYSDKHNGICWTLKMTVVPSSVGNVKYLTRFPALSTILSTVILLHLSMSFFRMDGLLHGNLPLSLVKRSFKTLLSPAFGIYTQIRGYRERHLNVRRHYSRYHCKQYSRKPIFPLDESALVNYKTSSVYLTIFFYLFFSVHPVESAQYCLGLINPYDLLI